MSGKDAEFAATMSLGFLAADFCLEPETFPVFVAWIQSRDTPIPGAWTRENLQPLVDNLRVMMYGTAAGKL